MSQFAVRAAACALALAMAGVLTPAHAQSRYTLTTLKTASNLPAQPLRIDSQGNVVGGAPFAFGTGNLTQGKIGVRVVGTWGMEYRQAPSRWPAGSVASVSPTRSGKLWGVPAAVSPDGSKFALGLDVYAMATGKLWGPAAMPSLPDVQGTQVSSIELPGLHALLDDGSLLLNYTLNAPSGLRRGLGLWQGSTHGTSLFEQAGGGIHGEALVSPTVALGWTRLPDDRALHGTVWFNGEQRVFDTRTDASTEPLRANSQGMILMCQRPLTAPTPAYLDGGRPVISINLQTVEVAPLNAGDAVSARGLNERGIVVGASGPVVKVSQLSGQPTPCSDTTPLTSRAIIWQDGQTQDLNAWVAARGLTLPAGSVLAEAIDINANNSILAVLRSANGSLSHVRLNAEP